MNFRRTERPIPEKANNILNLILIILLLIGARIWHLSVMQHDEKVEESHKPQKRMLIQKPERASIRDRFNEPLALNRVQYNAHIVYSKIKEIPQSTRKEYIKKLSSVVGAELSMDNERIEDLIYAKAALLGHIPLLIKEELSEKEYFRLKMLEKDFPGLLAERSPKRFYPKGRLASDIIGYMGAISKEEFDKILSEMRMLQEYIQNTDQGIDVEPLGFDPRKRLKELQERAYTINDYVGKSGIESYFDEHLRGFRGKKSFYSDNKGRFLKELPGTKEPLSGKRFLLTISSELQEFAEALLAENEGIREGKSIRLNRKTYTYETIKQPWIKGGAIIVMDPNNGEILTLATYPRFDPNDFIFSSDEKKRNAQKSNVYKWLELDMHVAELWDQKVPLTREGYSFKNNNFTEENKTLNWDNYLNFILPKEHPIKETLQTFGKLQHAVKIQQNIDALLQITGEHKLSAALDQLQNEPLKELKKNLDPIFAKVPTNYDKILLVDLYKLAAPAHLFSKELLEATSKKTIAQYKEVTCAHTHIIEKVQEAARQFFHESDFAEWKVINQKAYLQEMRALEKQNRSYQKPYLDYLDKKEKALFDTFWNENKYMLTYIYITGNVSDNFPYKGYAEALENKKVVDADYILLNQELSELTEELSLQYLATFRGFSELKEQLYGKYPSLRSIKGIQLEKHLAAAFYPKHGFGYGRSFAFRQAVQLGSVFKMVTAYTALIQPYKKNLYSSDYAPSTHDLNPLTIIDDLHLSRSKISSWNVGYSLDGTAIPQFYKGGRIPKSQHSHIGRVNLQEAIETSSNPYFSLLAGEVIESPLDLIEGAQQLSYGSKTGIKLPGEISGKIPKDLEHNKTGLYAFAIGQHSFVTTPLQTAVMISAIANKGKILEPKIVLLHAGKENDQDTDTLFYKENYPYKDELSLLGIDFPLFTAIGNESQETSITTSEPIVRREIFLPDAIRNYLLEAMKQVVVGPRGTARPQESRSFAKRPLVIKDYTDLQNDIVGKTTTAEMRERIDLSSDGVQMVNHVGFAGISFEPSDDEPFSKPELVVIVYLRFGDYGKEAAPLAAQIVKKWREIKLKHEP